MGYLAAFAVKKVGGTSNKSGTLCEVVDFYIGHISIYLSKVASYNHLVVKIWLRRAQVTYSTLQALLLEQDSMELVG